MGEPEVTVPNTAASVAGLGATLGTELEDGGAPDASTATGPALLVAAAGMAACPGTESGEGEAASTLTSGAPGAAGAASAEGTTELVLGAVALGLLPAGWAGAGSFLTESVCRGAWGSWADCCCPRSEVDAEASLLPGFSGEGDDVASSVLLPADTGRLGADAELRRLLKDSVGNDEGGEVAAVAGGGAGGGAVLLICWLPNEKPVLPPLRGAPPKLMTPGLPSLVSGRPPKTPAEELPVLVLAAAATTVVAATEAVTGGSRCFPKPGGLAKLNPEGTVDVLAGWVLVRLVDEVLMAGFVESSAWPTRSPEKLPRVSPAKELGNRISPNLDGGVSSLLEAVVRAIPEGATGLPLDGTGSPGEAAAAPVV